jgi:hypothetical protein
LTFKNDNEPSWIVFGGLKDHDTRVGIRAGKLKLAGLVLVLSEQQITMT